MAWKADLLNLVTDALTSGSKKVVRHDGYRAMPFDGGYEVYDPSGVSLGKYRTPEDLPSASSELDTSYRISHTAPALEGKNTLDDLSDVYPDDIYDPSVAGRYYGHGDAGLDRETAETIAQYRGNPDADVTVYRAVPKGVKDINPGDWVTVNRNYAESHGGSWVDDGEYDVISKKVKAKEVTASGDSIHEQGYVPAGTAAVAGLGAMGQSDESEAGPFGDLVQAGARKLVDRYHGTPHTFNEFDLSKMGTGEGAQAYGWGAYLAGNKGVADFYKRTLSDRVVKLDGNPLPQSGFGPEAVSAKFVRAYGGVDEAIQGTKEYLEKTSMPAEEARAALEFMQKNRDKMSYKPEPGNLYQAGAPADEHLLDYDKPLFEQSEEIRTALAPYTTDIESHLDDVNSRIDDLVAKVKERGGKPTARDKARLKTLNDEKRAVKAPLESGSSLYGHLSRELGSDQAASEYLDSLGIPGLRFLDNPSRAAGDGTHNYVIWDQGALGKTTKIGAAGGAMLTAGGLFKSPELQAATQTSLHPLTEDLGSKVLAEQAYLSAVDRYKQLREVGGYKNIPHGRINRLANIIDKYDDLPFPVVGEDYLGGVSDWLRGMSEVRDESSKDKLARAVIGALDILPY